MLYADANASVPLLNEVKQYLKDRFEGEIFANPNALHSLGRKLKSAIEKSRAVCAEMLGADPENIIFTSGASEGISTIFNNIKRILISSVEHEAVINASRQSDKIPVDKNGVVDCKFIKDYLDKYNSEVDLVSVMSVNNETGVLQPTAEISEMCRHYSIPFFSDTTQAIGKTDFNFKKSGFDFAVLSGHKIGALPGTGILLVKDPLAVKPLIPGAGQESGLRGGTENYLGIESLAVALNAFKNKKYLIPMVEKQRIFFEKQIRKSFTDIFIAGENAERICNTSMISYPGIHGQAVQIELESNGVYVTTTSACRDNEPQSSHVLKAMEVPDNIARGMIRISMLLDENIADNYNILLKALKKAYKRLGKIKSY